MVTNEDVVSLNISPFVDSKRYTLNKDGVFDYDKILQNYQIIFGQFQA